MTKQQKTALNMAKFIQNQSLLLLEKLNELDLDAEADLCEKLHDDAEHLFRTLSSRLDEFSHVQRCFLLFRHKGPQSISAQCKPVRGSDVQMVQRTDLR